MFKGNRGIRYSIYTSFLIFTFALIIGVKNADTTNRIILITIYSTVSTVLIYLARKIISLETLNNDLNPIRILKRRQIKRIEELEEKRKKLIAELQEKTKNLHNIQTTVSNKFETKKHAISEAVCSFQYLIAKDQYFSK